LDRPESLARRAYYALRKAIQNRTIEPETLYSELQLAATMNISRTPVREALIELSREGIIEVVPQRGFRVRTISETEEREVFDLRGVIESHVVRRLALTVKSSDIARMREMLKRQAKLADDCPEFLELDELFHLSMPTVLGLTRTRDVLSSLRSIILLTGSAALSLPGCADEVLHEHSRIVDCIAAHDPERAARAMTDHLDRTYDRSIEARRAGLLGPTVASRTIEARSMAVAASG
jgi:DNA-binding GntR family transcriptional regulator